MADTKSPIYNIEAELSGGKKIQLGEHEGKVLLIVNTASKCGFTPQYTGLEELYKKYKEKGLVVLGFPCDQFGNQEPGSDEEISQFCKINYGVSFPIFKKIEVNGSGAHPLFVYLKKSLPQFLSSAIKWNFSKFLVDRQGQPHKRYAPTVEPADLESDIVALLGQ